MSRKSKRINAEIPPTLLQKVKARLALEGRSIKDLLIELLTEWLSKNNK